MLKHLKLSALGQVPVGEVTVCLILHKTLVSAENKMYTCMSFVILSKH